MNKSKLSLGIFVIVATCLLIPISSKADVDITSHTGNELIRNCNNANSMNGGNAYWFACVEYVSGIENGFDFAYSILETTNPTVKPWYCIPQNVTRNQFALVVSKFLQDNPSKLNESDVVLVLGAYIEAWPCTKMDK